MFYVLYSFKYREKTFYLVEKRSQVSRSKRSQIQEQGRGRLSQPDQVRPCQPSAARRVPVRCDGTGAASVSGCCLEMDRGRSCTHIISYGKTLPTMIPILSLFIINIHRVKPSIELKNISVNPHPQVRMI